MLKNKIFCLSIIPLFVVLQFEWQVHWSDFEKNDMIEGTKMLYVESNKEQ